MLRSIKDTCHSILYGSGVESTAQRQWNAIDGDQSFSGNSPTPTTIASAHQSTVFPHLTAPTLRHRRVPTPPSKTLIALRELLESACDASRRLDPDAAEKWQNLYRECSAGDAEFSKLVDTRCSVGTTAVQCVLNSRDWASVHALHALLPDGLYAEGRVSRGENFLCSYALNHIPTGPTLYYEENKSYYEGDFIDGIFHGKAHIRDCDGYKYDGDMRGREMEGSGHISWPTGYTYDGQVSCSEILGHGTLTTPKGEKISKKWEKGEFSSKYIRKEKFNDGYKKIAAKSSPSVAGAG
jgi:hypothetical protein